jgi:hypothetical protein
MALSPYSRRRHHHRHHQYHHHHHHHHHQLGQFHEDSDSLAAS